MTAFNSAETVSRLRLCAHVGGLDFVQCDRFSCRVLQENVPQHASRERALSLLTAIANANMPLQAQKEKPQLEPLQKVVGWMILSCICERTLCVGLNKCLTDSFSEQQVIIGTWLSPLNKHKEITCQQWTVHFETAADLIWERKSSHWNSPGWKVNPVENPVEKLCGPEEQHLARHAVSCKMHLGVGGNLELFGDGVALVCFVVFFWRGEAHFVRNFFVPGGGRKTASWLRFEKRTVWKSWSSRNPVPIFTGKFGFDVQPCTKTLMYLLVWSQCTRVSQTLSMENLAALGWQAAVGLSVEFVVVDHDGRWPEARAHGALAGAAAHSLQVQHPLRGSRRTRHAQRNQRNRRLQGHIPGQFVISWATSITMKGRTHPTFALVFWYWVPMKRVSHTHIDDASRLFRVQFWDKKCVSYTGGYSTMQIVNRRNAFRSKRVARVRKRWKEFSKRTCGGYLQPLFRKHETRLHLVELFRQTFRVWMRLCRTRTSSTWRASSASASRARRNISAPPGSMSSRRTSWLAPSARWSSCTRCLGSTKSGLCSSPSTGFNLFTTIVVVIK